MKRTRAYLGTAIVAGLALAGLIYIIIAALVSWLAGVA